MISHASPSRRRCTARASEVCFRVAAKSPQPKLWVAALSRLLAINRQRHSYEQLFGGISSGVGSPRSLAVAEPRIRDLLAGRARALCHGRQQAILAGGERATGAWRVQQEEEQEEAALAELERARRKERAQVDQRFHPCFSQRESGGGRWCAA